MASLLDSYDYELPHELVAEKPASPRDSATLCVVDTRSGCVTFDTFRHLDRYLPPESLLFLMNEWKKGERYIKGMIDRGVALGAPLYLSKRKWLIPVSQNANIFTFEASFPLEGFADDLRRRGRTPIPPYLRATPLSESTLRKRYQTVFAKDAGSVAAPTASLHFTQRVFRSLAEKGVQKAFVRL